MKKGLMKLKCATIILAAVITGNVYATNLIDVYHQAFVSDPAFKAANEQWLADREKLPIANAALLPNLSAAAQAGRSRIDNRGNTIISTASITPAPIYYNNNSGYSLILSQPIFNFGSWATAWQAQDSVKASEATFLSSIQDLMLRTATAYFNVLQAQDILRYSRANLQALKSNLDLTQHRYDVGLIAITDLENAKSSYDKAIATEIGAANDLADRNEQLAEITGIKYLSLDVVKGEVPLVKPYPANIDRWVAASEKQNYQLLASHYTALAAKENIKIQNAQHLPVVNATGNYSYIYNSNSAGYGIGARTKSASGVIGVTLPLFSGGGVVAAAKQAEYLYQTALANEEKTHRSVTSNTTQSYLNVVSGISKIEADLQTIAASKSSLQATYAGYSAGTRTMVDVLTAQSDVYSAQSAYATDEYAYLIQTLTLKKLAGTLNVDDLQQINSWLTNAALAEKIAAQKEAAAKKVSQEEVYESEAGDDDSALTNQTTTPKSATTKVTTTNKKTTTTKKAITKKASAKKTTAKKVTTPKVTATAPAKVATTPKATVAKAVATTNTAAPKVVVTPQQVAATNTATKTITTTTTPITATPVTTAPVTATTITKTVATQPAATATQPAMSAATNFNNANNTNNTAKIQQIQQTTMQQVNNTSNNH